MPTAVVLVATPANTKFLNLWNGSSNDTPPTDWWAEGFDDSAWETPVAVIPDAGDTGIGLATAYGLQPMWGASDSGGVPAIILTRTHFTAPATVTDEYGVPLARTGGIPLRLIDLFNEATATSGEMGEIFDGSGTSFGTHGLNVLNYYNGTAGFPFAQQPNGPCFFEREVSNLHLGADNVFASAINLGITNCSVTTPYGPWSPATRSSFPSWFAWGFRFFDEVCSEYAYTESVITADMVKVLRFSGSPPADWQTTAFDDSSWDNAVVSDMNDPFDLAVDWDGWANTFEGGTGSGHHINGADISYEPIAVAPTGFDPPGPYYTTPPPLWAVVDETTADESVIMRIHWTAPSPDSIIRRSQVTNLDSTTRYDGTLMARDWAGFTSVTSYVNGFGGGTGIEVANFPQLITLGVENVIALLMTTDATSLGAGFSAWIQLGVQLANCGPIGGTGTSSMRSFAQIIGD